MRERNRQIDQEFYQSALKVFSTIPHLKNDVEKLVNGFHGSPDTMWLSLMFLNELVSLEKDESVLSDEMAEIVKNICQEYLGHQFNSEKQVPMNI